MKLIFLLGLGTGLVAREGASALKKTFRPFMKNLVKTGYLSYQKVAEGLGRLGESLEDVVAEVKNENGLKPEAPEEKEKEKRPKVVREGKHRTAASEETSHERLH